jgi:uncharacterized phage protein gp47/JayE
MTKTNYGLTDKGLSIPSFDAVKADIESAIVAQLGAIDFEVPSVYGVLTSIIAERELVVWEQVQSIFNSFFVDTATGTSLDYVVAGNLLSRLRPTSTKATCQLSGSNYTNIPAGSQILLKHSDTTFTLQQPAILSNESCFSININVINTDKVEYSITINGHKVTYTKLEHDTEGLIAESLSRLINEGGYNVVGDVISSSITITTASVSKSFSCFITDGLEITQVTNNAIFICDKIGNIAAPSHSLTEIQTPIQGWNSIDNISSGTAGRDLETDVELRKRQRDSLNIAGSATDYAIQARLAQVAGVTSVKVISDREAHTINALVLGGEDIDVAKTLQIVRPAGIKLIGNTEVVVTDSSGTQYAIKFTRPQNVYIFVGVNLTKNDAFKDAAVDIIKNKIINYVNTLGVSSIVAYQALYAAIYSVAGVTNAEVLIGGTIDESTIPTLKAENVTISDGQMPITHTNKITIIVA